MYNTSTEFVFFFIVTLVTSDTDSPLTAVMTWGVHLNQVKGKILDDMNKNVSMQ